MDLANLLFEAPGILKLLDSRSLKALQQVSRMPHVQVYDLISTIFIDNKEQVSLLDLNGWLYVNTACFANVASPQRPVVPLCQHSTASCIPGFC